MAESNGAPIDDASGKRRIFLHAVRNKTPDETVLVQATCLVAALGAVAAAGLAPHGDPTAAIAKAEELHRRELEHLKSEADRLKQLSRLDLPDVALQLKSVREKLAQAAAGRLTRPSLIRVAVGPFRAALEAAERLERGRESGKKSPSA